MANSEATFLESIINSLSEPIIVVSHDYRIIFMNKAARGLTRQVLPATDLQCHEIIHGRRGHCSQYGDECPVKIAFAQGRVHKTLRSGLTGAHDEILYEIEATPLFNKDGSIAAVVEIFHDTGNSDQEESNHRCKQRYEKLKKLFSLVEKAKQEWETALDGIEDLVMITDADGKIIRFNQPIKNIFNITSYESVLDTPWEKFLVNNAMRECTEWGDGVIYSHSPSGRSFSLKKYNLKTTEYANPQGLVITLHDMTSLVKMNDELEEAYGKLKNSHSQLLQQEKLASIGQLAAGVAHEINNPIGFVSSNLASLGKYTENLKNYINQLNVTIEDKLAPETLSQIGVLKKKFKVDYIIDDLHDLLTESTEGIDRVREIVKNLKSFSRVDQAEHKASDLNECLESTLNIVWNELKYKTTLNKDYGKLPLTKCYPQQLNQVFMNLLVNAAQAIEKQGVISIKTWAENNFIHVTITDDGSGIAPEHIDHLFEPFFTTKPVGKGTGLGLSIAYDIITEKHKGELSVVSEIDIGTTFTIKLPIVEDEA